jgi:branched-chain amino acid transport system substrate-binding protein
MMRRIGTPERTRRAAIQTLAVATLLAACTPVEGPAARAPERGPVEVDASLGVVRVQPGSPVVVRIVLDVEGDVEALAPVLEAAFRTAVEDFGAVQQGFRVELGELVPTSCDRGSGETVGTALADAAAADGVVAVLGPQCTETLLGLQDRASAAGLVVMTSRPQELTLTETVGGVVGQDRAEGTWRTAPSSLREAQAAAEFAFGELELTRAATVHDGGIASNALADAFRTRFEALGGTVVVARQVDDRIVGETEGSASARAELLDAIAPADVQVAFLPLPQDMLLAVNGGLRERTRLAGITRLTTSAAATPELLASEASLGLVLTGPVLDFSGAVSAVTGMSASQTLERVSAASGSRQPSGWWAYAYDAATLLLKAIEDASLIDVDGTFVLSRAELRETLARSAIGGLTGPVRCSPLGDCAAPLLAVRSHEDPAATSLGDLVLVDVIGD